MQENLKPVEEVMSDIEVALRSPKNMYDHVASVNEDVYGVSVRKNACPIQRWLSETVEDISRPWRYVEVGALLVKLHETASSTEHFMTLPDWARELVDEVDKRYNGSPVNRVALVGMLDDVVKADAWEAR